MGRARAGGGLTIHLTAEERKLIDAQAIQADMSSSTFMRMVTLGAIHRGLTDRMLQEAAHYGIVAKSRPRPRSTQWRQLDERTWVHGEWSLITYRKNMGAGRGLARDPATWWILIWPGGNRRKPMHQRRSDAQRLAMEYIEHYGDDFRTTERPVDSSSGVDVT